jgi:hypothetical protein
MDFEFPSFFKLFLSICIIFFSVILIVFISNHLTFLLEKIVSNLTILVIIHILIICFLFHFVRIFMKYLESQTGFVKLDNNVYLDTAIIIGPTIGATSNYLGKYIKEYLFKK